jgi:hypothetical protein
VAAPTGIFRLVSQEVQWANLAGPYSTLSFECVEDVLA